MHASRPDYFAQVAFSLTTFLSTLTAVDASEVESSEPIPSPRLRVPPSTVEIALAAREPTLLVLHVGLLCSILLPPDGLSKQCSAPAMRCVGDGLCGPRERSVSLIQYVIAAHLPQTALTGVAGIHDIDCTKGRKI